MKVWKLWTMVLCTAVLPLSACAGDSHEEEGPAPATSQESVAGEAVSSHDVGQVEQGVWTLQASCGRGAFATAYCYKRNLGAPAIGVYGCKARTTGRWIWWETEMCGVCADRGIFLECGTEA